MHKLNKVFAILAFLFVIGGYLINSQVTLRFV